MESHVRESAARIAPLIEQLVAEGLPPERIVLAGFSQGGVIASSPPCAIRCHWQACSACPPTWLRPTPCPAR